MGQVRKAVLRMSALTALMIATYLTLSSSLFAQDSAADNFNKKCAVCHGKDGLGSTAKGKKVHVKDVHANMKDSEAVMIKAVTDGKGDDMDSYKNEFTADQIKALVEYYRSLGK
jgi:cytochrome c6